MPTTIYRKFKKQQYHAKKRGIAWELSYEQWLEIWHTSGHFEERGTTLGKYVMHRHNDAGPYAVGNVQILVVEEHNQLAGALGNLAQGPIRDYPRPAHRGPYQKRVSRPLRPILSIEDELRLLKAGAIKRGWPTKARSQRPKLGLLD